MEQALRLLLTFTDRVQVPGRSPAAQHGRELGCTHHRHRGCSVLVFSAVERETPAVFLTLFLANFEILDMDGHCVG